MRIKGKNRSSRRKRVGERYAQRGYILFLILFVPCTFYCHANGDTIDFWHVKYNDSIVAELKEFDAIQITEKLIKTADTLSVFYFKDTQCETCLTDLLIVDPNGNSFMLIDRYHPGEWIAVSLNDLRMRAEEAKFKYFRFYYWERPGRLQDNSVIEPVTRKLIFSLMFK